MDVCDICGGACVYMCVVCVGVGPGCEYPRGAPRGGPSGGGPMGRNRGVGNEGKDPVEGTQAGELRGGTQRERGTQGGGNMQEGGPRRGRAWGEPRWQYPGQKLSSTPPTDVGNILVTVW